MTIEKGHTMKISQRVIRLLCLFGLWLGLGLQAHAQTDTVTYVYTDPQGTPLVKADASGNVIARYDYTPYGNAVTSLGSPPNGPGYTGHVNDPETGLVYMQARYYQPIGRFISPDPVEPAAGNVYSFNRYAYVNNNPIIHIDPSGKCIEDACIIEGIAVVEGVEAVVEAVEAEEAATAATTEATSAVNATTTTAEDAGAESTSARTTARVNSDGKTFTDATGRVRQGSSDLPGQGKRITNAVRSAERDASGDKCIYCGRDTTNEPGHPNSSQGDHIQPRAGDTEGGPRGDNSPGNTGNSCATCNQSKSNQPVLKWIQRIFGD